MADFPVSELTERYQIGRTHLYQVRLTAMEQAGLGSAVKKGGNKSFVNENQLKFLDSLNEWILQNGSDVDLFLYQRYGIGEDRSALSTDIDEQSITLAAIGFMTHALQNLKQSKTLENFYELEDACSKGWLIPSSKLAVLLGLKEVRGNRVERYGFVCERISKSGRESEWSINKLQRP